MCCQRTQGIKDCFLENIFTEQEKAYLIVEIENTCALIIKLSTAIERNILGDETKHHNYNFIVIRAKLVALKRTITKPMPKVLLGQDAACSIKTR